MKFLNSLINPTTANYAGLEYKKSVGFAAKLNREAKHMQLCPQQLGFISEKVAEDITNKYDIQFRCHANPKFAEKLFVFDASSDMSHPDNLAYMEKLKKVNSIIKAPAFSYHAGKRIISREVMRDNVLRLQDYLGIPTAVEGLYPNGGDTWLINSWNDYEWLLNSEIKMAIDLSHLQIVGNKEQYWNEDLVKSLVSSENCLEVHISSNDLIHDSHKTMNGDEIWIHLLDSVSKNAVIFSEENFNFKKRSKEHSNY